MAELADKDKISKQNSTPHKPACKLTQSPNNKKRPRPSPATQERNTQVVSIIYSQWLFPRQTFLRLS